MPLWVDYMIFAVFLVSFFLAVKNFLCVLRNAIDGKGEAYNYGFIFLIFLKLNNNGIKCRKSFLVNLMISLSSIAFLISSR